MSTYEEKQSAKKDRLLHRAAAAERTSNMLYRQVKQMAEAIPFGQPILVGHHSETRDRNFRNRLSARMQRAFSEADKAAHLRRRAEAVGTGGVSSDDPDAIAKLAQQLEARKAAQDRMKRANALIRRNNVAALADLGFSPEQIESLKTPDFAGRIGFPSYQITNNGAQIRRLEARIRELEQARARVDLEERGDGYVYREDAADNRVMFCFDSKPDADLRQILKRHGFRYSSTRNAWVRHLNGNGKYAAQRVRALSDAGE